MPSSSIRPSIAAFPTRANAIVSGGSIADGGLADQPHLRIAHATADTDPVPLDIRSSVGPEHVRHVLSTHELDVGDVAGVGDDVADMELFREAGIFSIGITGTRRREELLLAGAAAVIAGINELEAYVH